MTQAHAQSGSKLKAVLAPHGFSDVMLLALERTLAACPEHFSEALLAKAEYEGGGSGFLMVLSGVAPDAYSAFTDMIDEALASVERPEIGLDVTFLAQDDPAFDRLKRIGRALARNPETRGRSTKKGKPPGAAFRSQHGS